MRPAFIAFSTSALPLVAAFMIASTASALRSSGALGSSGFSSRGSMPHETR